ncbi:MAG: S1C family serine protease [Planctomycetes bacterium]|nr:S1C family serine protease [Planctomycetota bacterium]
MGGGNGLEHRDGAKHARNEIGCGIPGAGVFARAYARAFALLAAFATFAAAGPQIDAGRLKGFEGEIKRLVEHVRPAVVGVHVYTRKIAAAEESSNPVAEGTPTSATFEKTTLVIVSGIVRSAEGQIVTLIPNDLVGVVSAPDGAEIDVEIEVTLSNGEIYPAEWIASDDVTGITLLAVRDAPRLQPARVPRLELEENQFVVGIGNSYGLGDSVSLGFVSSTSRRGECERFVFPRMIQSSVAVNPGDLGGMLANTEGAAIGMIAFSYVAGEEAVSGPAADAGEAAPPATGDKVTFAIPYDLLARICSQLETTGRYRRGSLGMLANLVTRNDMQRLNLPSLGVLVRKVDPAGTAFMAGLQPGDIIINVANRDLRTMRDLNWFHEIVEYGQIEATLRLNVYRSTPQYKGFKLLNVAIGEREDTTPVAQRSGLGEPAKPAPPPGGDAPPRPPERDKKSGGKDPR